MTGAEATGEMPTSTPIERILKARRHRNEYAVVPTHIEGFALRAEAGTELDILRKTVGKLALLGTDFTERKRILGELTSRQEVTNASIKDIAKEHQGLRGMQSADANYKLNVFPRYEVAWKPEPLKEALGILYNSVVHEDLAVSISIPHGHKTRRGPLTAEMMQSALVKGLKGLGISEAELYMIIEPRVEATVDEDKLADLVEGGKVKLPENVADITETWAITVDPLNKSTS